MDTEFKTEILSYVFLITTRYNKIELKLNWIISNSFEMRSWLKCQQIKLFSAEVEILCWTSRKGRNSYTFFRQFKAPTIFFHILKSLQLHLILVAVNNRASHDKIPPTLLTNCCTALTKVKRKITRKLIGKKFPTTVFLQKEK